MSDIKIAFIKAPGKYGEDLYQRVAIYIYEKYGCECIDVVNECKNNDILEIADTQFVSMYLCLCYDLVLFDGSIENDDWSQYRFAYDLMKRLNYVIFLSRTELPYNFEGKIQGCTPSKFITVGNDNFNNLFSDKYTKEEINIHILEKLSNILNGSLIELPRSNRLNDSDLSSNNKLLGNVITTTKIIAQTSKLISYSNKMLVSEGQKQVFVSFVKEGYTLLKNERVISQIKSALNLESETQIHYYAPGNISSELMTERRRWEIFSTIDREIHERFIEGGTPYDPILIFETENYYKSWWSYGELLTFTYRYNDDWEKCPTIYICKPQKVDEDIICEWCVLDTPKKKKNYFPQISPKQKKQIVKRFVNGDPAEAGYEWDEIQSKIENVKKSLRIPSSYAYSKEFQTLYIYETKKDTYTVNDFTELNKDGLIKININECERVVDKDLNGNEIEFLYYPNKNQQILKLKKGEPYYRFIQPRYGQIIGGKLLVKNDRYLIT